MIYTFPDKPANPDVGDIYQLASGVMLEWTGIKWKALSAADKTLRQDLAEGTVFGVGNIKGNASKSHFSIGAIPRCNSDGVFELVEDLVHDAMNVSSVTQPDQYTIRINYSKIASKINSFIVAPDAELAPYGVVCGGDVGNAYANIQSYAPLSFIADNNSPTPSIVLNALWAPSYATGAITAVRQNSSTLRVTHPPSDINDPPVVCAVNSSSPYQYTVSYGASLVDITCVGSAKGYISYSGGWSQAFSDNVDAPTLTWLGAALRVQHGPAYNGAGIPVITGHGGGLIPQITNYGSNFFDVTFYDFAGAVVSTQSSAMQFWYKLDIKVPCNWPAGDIVSVQRGLCHVPSYNFKGVVGNNLWVYGDFEE